MPSLQQLLRILSSVGPSGTGGGGPAAPPPWMQSLLYGLSRGAAAGALAPPVPPMQHNIVNDVIGRSGQMMRNDMGQFMHRNVSALGNAAVMTATGGPIGAVTGAATLFANMVKNGFELPSLFLKWGEALRESQRHLKDFNGTLAASFADVEMRDIMRNVASGARTAGTTVELNKALNDFKDEFQKWGDLATNIKNVIATFSLENMGTMLSTAIGIALPGISTVLPLAGTVLKDLRDALNLYLGETEVTKTEAFRYMDHLRRLPPEITRPPRTR